MRNTENRLFTRKPSRVVKGMVLAVATLLMGSALCLIRPVPVLAYIQLNTDVSASELTSNESYEIPQNVSVNLNIDEDKTIKSIIFSQGSTLIINGSSNKKLNVTDRFGNTFEGKIIINSGTIMCTKLPAHAPQIHVSDIEINGGEITVDTNVEPAILADNSIKITDGKITVNNTEAAAILSNGSIKITGGNVTANGKTNGLFGGDNITISGSNTVVRAKSETTAAIMAARLIIAPPLKIIKPAGGVIDPSGSYVAEYVENPAHDVLICSGADDEKESGRIYRINDDEDDDEQEITKPAVINRDTLVILKMTGFPYGTYFAKQEQGAAAKAAFLGGRPAGYKSAFTFNVITNGKSPDTSLKNGSFTLLIPEEFRKAGRSFAITYLDKDGKTVTVYDTDKDPDTISVDVNFEGYAFELVYKD